MKSKMLCEWCSKEMDDTFFILYHKCNHCETTLLRE